ncbi:MAG: hypothetical protein WBB00_03780 [Mycobacterium sp.]
MNITIRRRIAVAARILSSTSNCCCWALSCCSVNAISQIPAICGAPMSAARIRERNSAITASTYSPPSLSSSPVAEGTHRGTSTTVRALSNVSANRAATNRAPLSALTSTAGGCARVDANAIGM